MSEQIVFTDGAAYERYMGKWSRRVGERFLEWLAPAPGLRWLDVGCGNGAFTATIVDCSAPAAVHGVDPSDAQLAFARTRGLPRRVQFERGDAMALPFSDALFDVAVMPLVIFFVHDPAKGVAEMARVVRPGGIAAAYAWDMQNDGFPYYTLQTELRALGIPLPSPPSPDASRIETLRSLWTDAGLVDVETCEIVVHRTFDGADDYWTTVRGGPRMGRQLAAIDLETMERLQAIMHERLPADTDGRITIAGRANAVKGRRR